MGFYDLTFDDVMSILDNPSVPDNISQKEKQEIFEKYSTLSETDQINFKYHLNDRIFILQAIVTTANKIRKRKDKPKLSQKDVTVTAEKIRCYSKLYDILCEYDNLKIKTV